MCRLSTAVKINACTRRAFPVCGSTNRPSCAKSSWHSTPGAPSATRTVPGLTRNPHCATANRCNVRYGTRTPRRASNSSIFTTLNGSRPSPPLTQARICSSCASSSSHDPPCPSGRAGRTASTTWPTSSSVTAPTPTSRTRPAASAAATYRRAVLRSTPARSAAFRSPAPCNHARSTSRTSTTLTSRNPTLDDLRVHRHDAGSQRAIPGQPGKARRVVP